ncbi:hypothetical protein ACH5RR_018214 [Cinchona calisaya]|uniref:Uncharacterized protein n=1 Tax=Cinchona calisaya TaxID=153742 RepID=A0ABD2ZPF5_9GENT
MEAEDVIALFDCCWFNQEIFKKSSNLPTSSNLQKIFDDQMEGDSQKPEFPSQLTIHTRSKSDQQLMSSNTISIMDSGYFSPDSVLSAHHFEGKAEFPRTPQPSKVKGDEKKNKKRRKKKAKKSLSKSLSELEFEELKGFMDLGFVFSEEDRTDSILIQIIPGLQRLGKGKDGEEERNSTSSCFLDESLITRPYLSEAWEVLDRRKKEKSLKNWRVPAVSNEIGMKDNLKWWAHIVASTVRS